MTVGRKSNKTKADARSGDRAGRLTKLDVDRVARRAALVLERVSLRVEAREPRIERRDLAARGAIVVVVRRGLRGGSVGS